MSIVYWKWEFQGGMCVLGHLGFKEKLRKMKMLKCESLFASVFSPEDNGKVTSQLFSADEANGFLARQRVAEANSCESPTLTGMNLGVLKGFRNEVTT